VPTHARSLTAADAAASIEEASFGTQHDRKVGIELEWLTTMGADRRRPGIDETEAVVSRIPPLPSGGRVTIEPGGQLELSTLPFDDAATACEAAATDLFVIEHACTAAGLDLTALGTDPLRQPERISVAPRYRAMQTHFDQRGPSGRTMMCNTASIQLNLGLGHDAERTRDRWRRANLIGPTLTACFANSPLAMGRPSGWVSTRLKAWWGIDPSRARPVPAHLDPVSAWVDYALDANVMLIRADEDEFVPLAEPFPFRAWLAHGHDAGWPDADDLAYHLTTLFPPVRPRGWFELRMLDALPTPFWHVAVAITTALLDDHDAGLAAEEATADTADLWVDAAQLGLGHPALLDAAERLFEIALGALEQRADDATVAICSTYYDRWVARGRCPADDRLDAWRATGELFPRPESPVRYAEYEALAT
jgi:glutamate--cysteine ligase